MRIAEAVERIDKELFEARGRPDHYPRAIPTRFDEAGFTVVDGGAPRGYEPHMVIAMRHELPYDRVISFSVMREFDDWEDRRMCSGLDEAIRLCKDLQTRADAKDARSET